MKPSELLEQAKAVIAKPEHWTKGTAARGPAGNAVIIDLGVCFCAIGALWKVTGGSNPVGSGGYKAETLLQHVAFSLGGVPLPNFNDRPETTHTDVLALYDIAIKKAQDENL